MRQAGSKRRHITNHDRSSRTNSLRQESPRPRGFSTTGVFILGVSEKPSVGSCHATRCENGSAPQLTASQPEQRYQPLKHLPRRMSEVRNVSLVVEAGCRRRSVVDQTSAARLRTCPALCRTLCALHIRVRAQPCTKRKRACRDLHEASLARSGSAAP